MAPKKQKKSAKAGSENKTENASEPEVRASGTCDNHEPEASEPQLEEFEQPAVTSTGTVARSSGGTRGVCAMHKVIVKKARGKKFKVTCNQWGIPNGETRARLQSYIGMLVRTTIPIDIANWTSVDPELKSKIWIDIQSTFKVGPHCEDIVLSKSTWKNFVKQRTDPSWTGVHEAQSERVSQRKYHHRLSRKGYIGLKEGEIKKGKLQPEEEHDREFFWQKARKRKNGEEVEEVDEDLAAVCEKIASHQPEKAFIVACSDDDDDVDECVATPAPPGVLGLRSCELSVNTIDNKVAFGMVYPGKDKEKVHGIDIPLGHKCVSVDGLLKPDALLPVLVRGEMVTVRDALGSLLAWTEGLIIYITLAVCLIMSFGRYLHSEISERPELAETFAFIDPGSTYYLNAEFETYIVNRLKEGNLDRLFFLPHNQNMHWILAIIWEGEIYFLNPLLHPVQFPDLEKALSRALKSFNSETGRGNHMPSKAKFLSGSPKKPSGMECTYVVMHYMKKIINDTRFTLLQSGYRRLACVTPRSSLMKNVLKLSDIFKSASEQFLVLLWFWTGYVDLNI
ncbi:hypothetical protein AgCh_029053 [Apium graveolens]